MILAEIDCINAKTGCGVSVSRYCQQLKQQPHLNVYFREMIGVCRAASHVLSMDSVNVIVIYVTEK